MDHIFAKTIYTGKRVVSNAHLQFNGKKISRDIKIKKGPPDRGNLRC